MNKLHKHILFLIFIVIITLMMLLSIKNVVALTSDPLIYLDAGHGGFDGGATSLDQRII